jgi:thiol:disulfide interchange protein
VAESGPPPSAPPPPLRGSARAFPRALVLLAAAFLVARVATGVIEERHPSRVADTIAWRDPQDAVTLARQTGKPILYEFGAEWCGPCHLLQNEVFADPRDAQVIESRYVPVQVTDRQREDGRNSPDVQALQDRYRIQAFPTLVMVDPDAGELGRLEGYPGARAVVQTLTETAARYDLKKGQFRSGGILIK